VTDGPSRLTVLAGPTAVGKGSVAADIREHHPEVWISVSATTRRPRPGEEDGVHYWFVSDEEFDRMVAQGELLEWAVVHNAARYGTPEALFVFLAPPSWEELVRRLVGRGTEDEAERERRLATAVEELAAEAEFDVSIVNHEVHASAEELVALMRLGRDISGPDTPGRPTAT
jgi:guanylate kinase